MATHYDMSTWCVLHENPTTEKMVGSLGSIAQRKVTEVFAVRKHKPRRRKEKKPNRPPIYFSVEQLKARGKDVEDFGRYSPSKVGAVRRRNQRHTGTYHLHRQPTAARHDEADRRHCWFMSPPNSEYFSNIVKELKKRMHVGETKAKEYFNEANSAGVFQSACQWPLHSQHVTM